MVFSVCNVSYSRRPLIFLLAALAMAQVGSAMVPHRFARPWNSRGGHQNVKTPACSSALNGLFFPKAQLVVAKSEGRHHI